MRNPTSIRIKPRSVNRFVAALLASTLLSLGASSGWAGGGNQGNPAILPPQSHPHGKTYGEWAAAWWQWALSIPGPINPLTDTTGEFAGAGQQGPVWFLAGTLGNSAERTVTVPAGKTIFMPVHNWIFGSAVFDCDPTVPGVTCEIPELRAKAAAATTGAEVLEAWIDGRKVNHIRGYRAISPEPFSITLPDDSVVGVPAGTYHPQVADGFWLMLAPPEKGRHTVRVHVVNSAFGIDMDLVIHLNVVKPAEVVPPSKKHRGQSYGEWSAAYWQWLFSLPVDGHPGTDSPNFDVTAGQSGHVWFLTGPFGTVERNVTVPAGKSLFIALINVDSSTLEEPPFFGATAAEQLAIANGFADYITDLSFTVDGQSVNNIGDFRVTSPQFTFTAPTPWIFGATGGTGTATGVGYFVMLAPLPVGTHTVRYTGAFKFSDAPEDYIGVNMTYNITVAPPGHDRD